MEKNYYSIDKCKTFLLLLYVIYMLYCGSLNYNNSIMYQERLPFYKELEESRGSRLVVYITGDRMGMETQMGIDALDRLVGHLDSFDNSDRITLFLHSRGGATNAGWSIANLIRSYCKEFEIIVPARAQSAATLLCLGADKIIMTKQASLGPIDPSVNSPLNPPIEGAPPQIRQSVSVESIKGFVQLAKEEFEIKDADNMTQILTVLSNKVHPLVLGEVFRARTQIRMLARSLLEKQFKNPKSSKNKIDKIVSFLCSDSGSHDYTINRIEAKNNLGLKIEDPKPELYTLIMKIYSDIVAELELSTPFNPAVVLSDSESKQYSVRRALIETTSNGTDVFVSEGTLRKQNIQTPSGIIPAFQDNRTFEGWRKEQ